MSDSTDIILRPGHDRTPARRRRADDPAGPPPAIVAAAGAGAEFAWDEFFKGQLPNAYTRRNYAHAVRDFLAWCDHPHRQIPLVRITPGHVGDYLAGLELATPTKKLRLAALRKFFDPLVVRHVVVLNSAASVRAERYSTDEGKTPEIGAAQARDLLRSIDASDLVGLRDRAILAVLIYTTARVGAVAKLTLMSLRHDGTQYSLRFLEKGGKARVDFPTDGERSDKSVSSPRGGQRWRSRGAISPASSRSRRSAASPGRARAWPRSPASSAWARAC